MPRQLTLVLPAKPADVSVLRTMVMSIIGSSGATVEEVADAGLAVDEAAGLLLSVPGSSSLEAQVETGARILMRVDGSPPLWPPTDYESSIAATVLGALASSVEFSDDDAGAAIELDLSG